MLFELLFKIEIKKAIIPALILFTLAACSPQKRVNRIVERYNLSIKDTTILRADTLQTVFSKSVFEHDTVFFYHTDTQTQKIYIKGDTLRITNIVPERTIVTEKIKVVPEKKNRGAVAAACIFGILFFLLAGLLFYMFVKKTLVDYEK